MIDRIGFWSELTDMPVFGVTIEFRQRCSNADDVDHGFLFKIDMYCYEAISVMGDEIVV